MADRYLWNGGSDLAAAADWIDLSTGQTPAGPPRFANTATIGPVGGVAATGTLIVGALTLGADLLLNGWILTGGLALAGGTIDLAAAGTLTVGTASRLPGTIEIGADGQLAGSGRIDAPVGLAGTLGASGGALGLFGAISGSGTLAIGAGAALFSAGGVGAGVTAAFQGAGGTLELFTVATPFAATIAGFAAGDVIDITASTLAAASYSAGILTLTAADGDSLALALSGSYDPARFVLVPDAFGGTAIVLAASSTLPALAATLALGGAVPTLYHGSGVAGTVASSGTVALAGRLTASRVVQSGRLTVTGGGTLSAGTLSVAGQVAALGGGAVAAVSICLAGGTLSADAQSGVAIGTGSAGNGGTITLGAGGTLTGSGRIAGTLAAAGGTLTASGGLLALFGSASGSGTLVIAAGATLFAGGSVGAGITTEFLGGAATLDLFAPESGFSGTLENFAAGDALDLGFSALTAASWSAGTLTLAAGGGTVAALPILGDYGGQSFSVQPDGAGGSLVTLIACLAAGTAIATPSGAVPVETLRPGDAVLTHAGPRRLRWVGRRGGDAWGAPELRPVRIGAHALGPGWPVRDLLLSPQHAVLVEGVLVPAIALLHDGRVVREPAGHVDYCHLGLDAHAILFAEGLSVESFLPGAAAPDFDREFGARPAAGPSVARRLEGGARLEALRAALFGGAAPAAPPGALLGHLERLVPEGRDWRLEGWARDAAAPSLPVALDVLRDGIGCGRIVANIWRPDLDRAGLGDGRCGFCATIAGPPDALRLHRAADGAALPAAPRAKR